MACALPRLGRPRKYYGPGAGAARRALRSSCAADGVRSRSGPRLLAKPLIRRLATEPSMGPVEVVEALPLLEPIVEQLGVVDHDPFEHPVELLLVDPVRPLHLPVQPRGGRLDVDVSDPGIKDVVVELRLELGAVVCLNHLDLERELLEHVVDELNRGLLVEPVVDPQHPDPRAVIDRGELVVLLPRALQRSDELHVDLDPVPGQWLLVALPPVDVPSVALGSGKPAHVQAPQDPPDPRRRDLDVVVALEVHRDLVGSEVIALAQVDDLADDLGLGGVRDHVGPSRTVPEPLETVLLVPAEPDVVGLARDPVVAAGQRDVAGHLLGMSDDRQTMRRRSGELSLGHRFPPLRENPMCTPCPSVPENYVVKPDTAVSAGRWRWKPRHRTAFLSLCGPEAASRQYAGLPPRGAAASIAPRIAVRGP